MEVGEGHMYFYTVIPKALEIRSSRNHSSIGFAFMYRFCRPPAYSITANVSNIIQVLVLFQLPYLG